MYTPYVSATEYTTLGYTAIPADSLNKFLVDASRNVDKLTFNRIVKIGFDHLTDFRVVAACMKHF